MTDNGLAALTARLERADFLSPNGYPTAASFAAAILGPRGVFFPEGLPEFKPESPDQWASPAEWQWLVIENAERVAALRAAQDVRMVVQAINAVAKRHGVAKDPPERPLMHIFGYTSATPDMDAEIAAEYAALARAEETP